MLLAPPFPVGLNTWLFDIGTLFRTNSLDPKHAPSWLDWQTVLREISSNLKQSRPEYIRFVEAGVGDKLNSPLAGAVAAMLLGTATWVERMQERTQSYARQPAVPARRRRVLNDSS